MSVEDALKGLGRYLSRVLDTLEALLAKIGVALSAAVKRTARSVISALRAGFRNVTLLIKLSSIFLALVWIGSFFLELVYRSSWFFKVIGVLGVTCVSGIIVGGLWTFFQPQSPVGTTDKKSYTLHFAVINALALAMFLEGMYHQYEFKTPVLRRIESAFRSVLISNSSPLGTWTDSVFGGFKRWFNEIPSTDDSSEELWIGVESKGVEDNHWARAYRTDDGIVKLNLWAETLTLTSRNTILNMATKTWDQSSIAGLRKADGAYFVDDAGYKYEIERDTGDYGFFGGDTHVCHGDEIYRFRLIFPRLSHSSSRIILHHPQFEPLELNLGWNRVPRSDP